jgi:hypothetical protein
MFAILQKWVCSKLEAHGSQQNEKALAPNHAAQGSFLLR